MITLSGTAMFSAADASPLAPENAAISAQPVSDGPSKVQCTGSPSVSQQLTGSSGSLPLGSYTCMVGTLQSQMGGLVANAVVKAGIGAGFSVIWSSMFNVQFMFLPASTPASTPVLTISGNTLAFTVTANSQSISSQTLVVTNSGGGTLNWSAHVDYWSPGLSTPPTCPDIPQPPPSTTPPVIIGAGLPPTWPSVVPPFGSLGAGQSANVTVTVCPSGLGVTTGTPDPGTVAISGSGNGLAFTADFVNVNVTVVPPPPPGGSFPYTISPACGTGPTVGGTMAVGASSRPLRGAGAPLLPPPLPGSCRVVFNATENPSLTVDQRKNANIVILFLIIFILETEGPEGLILFLTPENLRPIEHPRVAAAAAPNPEFLLVNSVWSFNPPVPADGTFAANVTFYYDPADLPDDTGFSEAKLQVFSYDPAGAGQIQVFPTTVDTTQHTATAQVSSIAPSYGLIEPGPFAPPYFSQPLLSTVSGIPSGFSYVNLGSSAANLTLAPYLDSAASAAPVKQSVASGAQYSAMASSAFSLGSGAQGWAQIGSDQNTVVGLDIVAGPPALDVLETPSHRWYQTILTDIEFNSAMRPKSTPPTPAISRTTSKWTCTI